MKKKLRLHNSQFVQNQTIESFWFTELSTLLAVFSVGNPTSANTAENGTSNTKAVSDIQNKVRTINFVTCISK